jgi:glycosyltransferase involved in cell wall biosynthesis
MFPDARQLVYCEFFYGAEGRDIGFDPEFPMSGRDGHIGLQLKNATTLLALADCDVGISPTYWQQSTFPRHYQSKIEVIHEGIDTSRVRPDAQARLMLPNGRQVGRSDEIVTFVVRNLEPLRGYHIFMRALPEILRRRPNAQIVIIGRDGLSYGLPPPAGSNWKSIFLEEVRHRLDMSRIHFMGGVPYNTFIAALQVSSAHVYLTYPFVLSWSALEAMSAGCLVIGSDTAPVREVINPGDNGLLVPFFAVDELAEKVVEALQNPDRFNAIREATRRFVIEHYDAARVCVPRMRQLLDLKSPATPARRNVWTGRTASEWPRPAKRASRKSFTPIEMKMSDKDDSLDEATAKHEAPKEGLPR